MTPAEALAERIRIKEVSRLEKRVSFPQSSHSNRASELGHPCLRYLVLRRVAGETAEPHGVTLQSVFDEGRLHEKAIKQVLSEFGIDVYGAERSFPPNSYNITGHVDALYGMKCKSEGGKLVQATVGMEFKSVNHHDWMRLNSPEDVRDSKTTHIAGWYTQSQIYSFLSELLEWLWIFKSKTTGRLKPVVTPLDLDYTEKILDKADAVNKHVEEGTLPDFHADRILCRSCRFYRRSCDPPDSWGDGIIVVSTPQWLEIAGRIVSTSAAAKECAAAKKSIRELVAEIRSGQDREFLFGSLIVSVTESGKSMVVRFKEVRDGDPEGNEVDAAIGGNSEG